MKNNVLDNSSIRNCTSCGLCVSVCGKDALSLQLDNEGFYRPVIDEEKCVECGICKMSCYKYDNSFQMSDEIVSSFAATNRNESQLLKSSSGGISRLLMEECITRGYRVFGCMYNPQSEDAHSIVTDSLDDLDKFYGSKYFQSYTVDGFSEIIKDKSSQKYALFGTPCQIYAFSKTRKYIKSPDNYLLVDIFCHGCPSMNLWKANLASVKKSYSQNVFDEIFFRTKKYGWHEYCIDFKSGISSHSSKKIDDPFFDLFFSADIMNEACYDCKARSTMTYSDIRIGDFWGPRYELNDKGVSAVLIGSPLGTNIFDTINDKIIVEDANFNEIISAQSYGRTLTFNTERRKFLLESIVNCDNLSSVHEKYVSMLPFSIRIKKTLKGVVKHLPKTMYFPIRKLLHLIYFTCKYPIRAIK